MPATLNLTARSRAGLPLYDLDVVAPFGVDAVVTGRLGGVSSAPYDSLNLGTHVGDDPLMVAENRRRVADALGLEAVHLIIAHQVHGARVHDIDRWDGDALEGDALVTTRRDVALAVLVADCAPLLFVEPDGPRLGVAHAGWRGLVAGVIPATLAHFRSPRDLRVVIGPHISRERYQVGPEVAEHFAQVPGACVDDVDDRSRLDLGAVALDQLLRAGVGEENITQCRPATDDAETFYSDRAQRPCGRFGLVARRASYDSSVSEGST